MSSKDLEEFARTFFAAVDAQHAEGLRPYLSDDVRLQMANIDATEGVDALIASFEATEARFSSIATTFRGSGPEAGSMEPS